jgi:hypothetical protein
MRGSPFPSRLAPTSGRQFEYHQTLEIPPDLTQRISTEALRAYGTWRDEQSETKTQGASREQSIPSR